MSHVKVLRDDWKSCGNCVYQYTVATVTERQVPTDVQHYRHYDRPRVPSCNTKAFASEWLLKTVVSTASALY